MRIALSASSRSLDRPDRAGDHGGLGRHAFKQTICRASRFPLRVRSVGFHTFLHSYPWCWSMMSVLLLSNKNVTDSTHRQKYPVNMGIGRRSARSYCPPALRGHQAARGLNLLGQPCHPPPSILPSFLPPNRGVSAHSDSRSPVATCHRLQLARHGRRSCVPRCGRPRRAGGRARWRQSRLPHSKLIQQRTK